MNRETGKPLFIFELANNHQGSVEHGLKIIREIKRICLPYEEKFDFGIKFQYRNIDTFVRPDYLDRKDIKHIKRFLETKLKKEEFLILLEEVKKNGFLAICTPFDEISVDHIVEDGYDIIKIASCSFCDWPLLEKIGQVAKRVIASCATASLVDIKKVVDFFQHRNIEFSLMHCIAEYPTEDSSFQLNQIDVLKDKFKGIKIGFSTHEAPENRLPISIAIAKGCSIFEKHVGLSTESISLNAYSSDPNQIKKWLSDALRTYEICGISKERYSPSKKETEDLEALRRGVFLKNDKLGKEKITEKDVFFAFPCEKNQFTCFDFSKYRDVYFKKNCELVRNMPIMEDMIRIEDKSERVKQIVNQVMVILRDSKVIIPINSLCELSHHYGLERYEEIGLTLINCVNREYCKKILVMLPGQKHPNHYHIVKEETFVILYGELRVCFGNVEKTLYPGETMVVERGVDHGFSTEKGCVFEEISTTHILDDSYYEKQNEFVTPRKTKVYLTKKMIDSIQRL